MTYYLAIDIGASGGRHILGSLQNGKIVLEEIYRFENGMTDIDGVLSWDIQKLTGNITDGLKMCREKGKIPSYVGIDTWGVDYVLLDEAKKEILPVYAYRDNHTYDLDKETDKILPKEEVYKRTGVQPIYFNSIYQLYRDKISNRLQRAKHFLMMPDYLSYRLTGIMSNEYTIASTSSLVNAELKAWDFEIIEKLGFPKDIFLPLSKPCSLLGSFSEEVQKEVGYNAQVIRCAGHDTACAFASCPIDEKSMIISSGTWSLIGTENQKANCDTDSMKKGFTNEGGVEYKFRFLENIMGMWLFQSIRKNLDKKYTYDEMMEMGMRSTYNKMINPNDTAFASPESMIEAVRESLGEKDLPIEDVIKSVYISLANSYKNAVETIEMLSDKKIENIIIGGGGSKDAYLNRLTAECTGKKVFTGLDEATATGNILCQIMFDKKINLLQGREIVKNTFTLKELD